MTTSNRSGAGQRALSHFITTKKLAGMRVVAGPKRKRVGKVRYVVFHPSERRCIGFTVKRPDAALMFRRKDLFVALAGFDVEEGEIVVRDERTATDSGALKALGVDWDSCVIWVGMPLRTVSGEALGYVDVVKFDRATGAVESISTEDGAANNAILGKRVIPGKLVKGFKRGADVVDEMGEVRTTGAIIVADEAADIAVEGGVAAAAGKASAVVADKAKKQVRRVKPKAQSAAKKTGEAVDAAAFAAGRQLGRASGMFAAFKEEYDKAVRDEET